MTRPGRSLRNLHAKERSRLHVLMERALARPA